MAGLGAECWAAVYRMDLTQASAIDNARVWFFVVIILTQLSMALLIAPISTAGAFSTEMARGHVFLILATGLTPAEIVFGTLSARMLAVLSSGPVRRAGAGPFVAARRDSSAEAD